MIHFTEEFCYSTDVVIISTGGLFLYNPQSRDGGSMIRLLSDDIAVFFFQRIPGIYYMYGLELMVLG